MLANNTPRNRFEKEKEFLENEILLLKKLQKEFQDSTLTIKNIDDENIRNHENRREQLRMLQMKKDQYLQELQELEEPDIGRISIGQQQVASNPSQAQDIIDLDQIHQRAKAIVDEYAQKRDLLTTLQQLPPNINLAKLELAKLQQELRRLGGEKRSLLSATK